MNGNYKLKTIGTGSKFTYGGISWVLLQKSKTAALCLAEKVLFNKAFDEDDNNNWAESSLRKYLNGEYLDQLAAAGADKAAFTPFTVDLTADDGLKDYSKVTDRLNLITCDLYRKHRYTIPNADQWWWTATPWSTASNGYSCNVRYVDASGALYYYYAYNGISGVRPLCNLNSSILVSVTDLKDYTPEEPEEKEPAEQKKEPAEKSVDVRKLHTTAIKRAYEALDKMQANFINGSNTDGDLTKIANAIATLQAVTGITLTDEEKATLHQKHADAVDCSYKCVQLSFDLYIEEANWNYPKEATEALAMLKALIG